MGLSSSIRWFLNKHPQGKMGEIMASYPSIINFRSSKIDAFHEIFSVPRLSKSITSTRHKSAYRSLGASDAIARFVPGGRSNFRNINELEANPSQGLGPTLFTW